MGISKNLQPSRNLASEYINKLQANSNKLEAINETIRKYNDALNLCREGVSRVGMVQNAMEPQRMLNYWLTAATEQVALAPRAPYLVALGQTDGLEHLWNQANTRNLPYLPYKPVSAAGSLAPPPQRNQFEPAIAGISQMFHDVRPAAEEYHAHLQRRARRHRAGAVRPGDPGAAETGVDWQPELLGQPGAVDRVMRAPVDRADSDGVRHGARVTILSMDGTDRQVWLNRPFQGWARSRRFTTCARASTG